MVRHSSRIELSQSALKKNMNFIRGKVGIDTKIASVVKANAYGHGIDMIVPMLEKCGIDFFATASAFEAEQVFRSRTKDTPIMIMGILYDEDVSWAINNDIHFFVFNYERLITACEAARKLNKKAHIHLEVETGANRTGIPQSLFSKAITYLKKNQEYLEFTGLCTHFAGIENLSNQFRINSQHEEYKALVKVLEKRKYLPQMKHIACSAAAIAFPETTYDLVRVGVAQYGFWPSPDIYYLHLKAVNKMRDNPLRRVISWKTDIMEIRNVNANEFIGYGTSYQARCDMRIAVVPTGYSDGYPRGLSNKGSVLIKGKKSPVIGLVNMNMLMVDISHLEDVKTGDEVVLIGRQGKEVINVSSFSNFLDLLNTEMMSRLPACIPRKVVR